MNRSSCRPQNVRSPVVRRPPALPRNSVALVILVSLLAGTAGGTAADAQESQTLLEDLRRLELPEAAAPGLVADRPTESGWQLLQSPSTGRRVEVFLPRAVDPTKSVPAAIFLHGQDSPPRLYRERVQQAAEELGVLMVLPHAGRFGTWGFSGDSQVIAESTRFAVQAGADPERIGIAGHSAGGAYAYVQAYLGPQRFSGVFSMNARYIEIEPADGFKPPIRMFYGSEDRNFKQGALQALARQWERLGIIWEDDLAIGYQHHEWPAAALVEGLRFATTPSGAAGPSLPSSACEQASDTRLCLVDGRFEVEVKWWNPGGSSDAAAGRARVVPIRNRNSGLFWFFSEANWEMIVKVLNGCSINGNYWVFAAATTDRAYQIRVTDTFVERTVTYESDGGHPAPALTDTEALSSCP